MIDTMNRGEIIADRYRLSAKIHASTRTIVYVAEDLKQGRSVVVKILREDICGEGRLKSFFDRAQRLSRVVSPHIVRLFDFGVTHADRPYLVFERIRGSDLRFLLDAAGGPLPWAQVLDITIQICDALNQAHQSGLVHGRLRPSCCLLPCFGEQRSPDFIKLIGFDSAVLVEDTSGERSLVYAAPEQLQGGDIEPSSDIYSVGVMLYRMLTGQRPPLSEPPGQSENPPRPSSLVPSIPRDLDDVVLSAMSRDPRHRPVSARALTRTLREIKTHQDLRTRPLEPCSRCAEDDTCLTMITSTSPCEATVCASATTLVTTTQATTTTTGMDPVHLGASLPATSRPGETFVVRFSAYISAEHQRIQSIVDGEAPKARSLWDLGTCQWARGVRVTVTLRAAALDIETPTQSFTWSGRWNILRFDGSVPESVTPRTIPLRLDVAVEGTVVATLRPELEISTRTSHAPPRKVRIDAPRTAFASFAGPDRWQVFSRVRSLQIYAGLDVFLDCMAMRPGDRWQQQLQDEIRGRDVFLLFWSRNAMRSNWVDWEWRQALDTKGLDAIQPHPLESARIAPPPAELSELQFGGAYEEFLCLERSSLTWRGCILAREVLSTLVRAAWRRTSALVRRCRRVVDRSRMEASLLALNVLCLMVIVTLLVLKIASGVDGR